MTLYTVWPRAETRMIGSAAGGSRHPDVSRGIEQLVFEILIEQSELPELVRDVFADVRDGAVGSDDDLVVVMALACRVA